VEEILSVNGRKSKQEWGRRVSARGGGCTTVVRKGGEEGEGKSFGDIRKIK